jgi:hypothetical protein
MDIVTTKVWKQTLTNLKILAAMRGKTMLSVLDELVARALEEEQTKKANWLRTTLKENENEK